MSGGPLGAQVQRIAAEAVAEIAERKPAGIVILDVRPRAAFDTGHVPGSLHCPVHDLARNRDALPARTRGIIVVGEPGARSDGAAAFLVLEGYPTVAVLDGGWPAWQALERGVS